MSTYAVVTGASKGIGKELAIQLKQQGYSLVLIARPSAELNQLAEELGGDTLSFAIDLSDQGASQKVAEFCKDLPISVLINNAGYGLWAPFESAELSGQLNMLQLNINAVVELTHYLLPQLKKQPSYILTISSTAAYQAVPTLAIYAATKAFILSFSRALRLELMGSVSVSCLSPGPTNTGFAHRAGMDSIAKLTELAEKFNMQPDEVARIGLAGMFQHKAEIIPGFLNKLSAVGARHINKAMIERLSSKLYK